MALYPQRNTFVVKNLCFVDSSVSLVSLSILQESTSRHLKYMPVKNLLFFIFTAFPNSESIWYMNYIKIYSYFEVKQKIRHFKSY